MHDAVLTERRSEMLKRCALLFALVGLPQLCMADAAIEKAVVAQNLEKFEQEAATVRQGMQGDGVYAYMSDADKRNVEKQLDAMHKLLQEHPQGLSSQDKVQLLNTQGELNALLLQNDNNRLVCENGTRTGSRIHVTSCRTHGEIVRREQHDRQALSDVQRQPQTQKPAGN